MILRPIECQNVLEFSSFTDDTFTDFDGIILQEMRLEFNCC